MKKVLFSVLAIIMIGSLNLCAQEEDTVSAAPDTIAWFYDYNDAINTASTEGRYMLIKFYTDWCTWCKRLDTITFTDTMIATLSKSFVFLKTNAEVDTILAKKYGVAGFPTMVITKPNGVEIDRLVGYYPPMDFLPALFDLLMNRNTLDDLLSKAARYPDSLQLAYDIAQNYEYKSDLPNARFYYNMIMEKDPDNAGGLCDDSWLALAGLLRKDGKTEEAVDMYLGLSGKYPESDQIDDAFLSAAGVYRREGQVRKAVKMYEEFQKKYPESDLIDDARVLIPYTYHKNDDVDKALKLYKQYLEKYPDTDNSKWVQNQISSIEEEKGEKK